METTIFFISVPKLQLAFFFAGDLNHHFC